MAEFGDGRFDFFPVGSEVAPGERPVRFRDDRGDLIVAELLARASRLGELGADRVEVPVGEGVQRGDDLRGGVHESVPSATARTTSSAVTTPTTRPSTRIGIRWMRIPESNRDSSTTSVSSVAQTAGDV